MFITTGGSYKGTDYSTMYHNTEKYANMSPNQKYYILLGNVDDSDGPTKNFAVLVFSVETNKMVYAEPITETQNENEYFEIYEKRIANKLCERLDWLKN